MKLQLSLMKRNFGQLKKLVTFSAVLVFMFQMIFAQNIDYTKDDLNKIQVHLAKEAKLLLHSQDVDKKIKLLAPFFKNLKKTLERPESFDFKFDSLVTISRLESGDGKFNIFTWYIADNGGYHRYFGLIQRKFYDKEKDDYKIIVYSLIDKGLYNRKSEAVPLKSNQWFGALYYKLLHYQVQETHYVPKDKNADINSGNNASVKTEYETKVINGKKVQFVKSIKVENAVKVTKTVNRYVLLGWNGHDNLSNFKVIDALDFKEDDEKYISLGLPIFYFGLYPKFRVVFEYANLAPFSLNTEYVKTGGLFGGKKEMIVFDHLSLPEYSNQTSDYELGPDGSYDALEYINGVFLWHKNVNVITDYLEGLSEKDFKKMQKEEQKRLKDQGFSISYKKKKKDDKE